MSPARVRLAAVLVVVGVVAATVWWTTWVATRSILDTDRSPAVGEALVEDPQVQEEVSDQVIVALRQVGAATIGFTDADIQAAADQVALDPEVAPAIADRVADAHRSALRSPGSVAYPTLVDDQVFVDASIRALEQQRPDLTIPDQMWTFSTTVGNEFPDLGAAARSLEPVPTPALLIAIVTLVASAVLYPDRRPRRWLARWCLIFGPLTLLLPTLLGLLEGVFDGDAGTAVRAISGAVGGGLPRRGAVLVLAVGMILSLGTWAQNRRATASPPPEPPAPSRLPSGPIPLGSRPASEIERPAERRPA